MLYQHRYILTDNNVLQGGCRLFVYMKTVLGLVCPAFVVHAVCITIDIFSLQIPFASCDTRHEPIRQAEFVSDKKAHTKM